MVFLEAYAERIRTKNATMVAIGHGYVGLAVACVAAAAVIFNARNVTGSHRCQLITVL
jgi:Ethanolamine utilization protein EutJ (predicted chaperonin)